jgi:hypothetical protein
MAGNPLKDHLVARQSLFGGWCSAGSPFVSEVIADSFANSEAGTNQPCPALLGVIRPMVVDLLGIRPLMFTTME